VWAGADFSGLGDLKTLFHFLEASNYCFGYSDSDGDNDDPSRECFQLETDEAASADQGGAGPAERRDATPPPNATHADRCGARGAASAPTGPRRPDLEQLKELEAKLEEERVRLRQLRESLEHDQPTRGDGGAARRRTRDVNRHITEDAGGEDPSLFSIVSQSVMAAALLLKAMPEPSTPEGRVRLRL